MQAAAIADVSEGQQGAPQQQELHYTLGNQQPERSSAPPRPGSDGGGLAAAGTLAAPPARPASPAPTTAAAAAAPSPAAPAAAPASGRLLYLIVTQGADSAERCDGGRPAGARYTRDSVRALLQLLGCKPRLAHKVMGLVFASIEAAVAPPAAGAGGRQQRTSRRPFAVHAHGGEGRVAVSLPRAEFMQLVSAAAAQFSYKIAPTSDELKVATG
jgi:hypothetical protein